MLLVDETAQQAVMLTVAATTLLFARWWRHAQVAYTRDSDARASARPELWTVHNKRYDLHRFVDQHPGGRESLLLGRGRNCTELFESYHSLSAPGRVSAVLAKYYVEEVGPKDADYDDTFEWDHTPIFDTLKARVRAHFQRTGCTPKAGVRQLLQLGGCSVVALVLFLAHLQGHMWATVLFPLAYWLGPSACLHDGTHLAITKWPAVNWALAYLGSMQSSVLCWTHQHVIGHHVHTNMAVRDPDLYHFSFTAKDGVPGFRTSIESRPMPSAMWGGHVGRAVWWRLGFVVRAVNTTLGQSFLWPRLHLGMFERSLLGLVPMVRLTWARLATHTLGRCAVVGVCFGLPFFRAALSAPTAMWALPLGLVAAFLPMAIHGLIYYAFSQVSHVQPECFRAGSDHKRAEWAEHQIAHAMDYAVRSRVHLHMSLGLNNQIIHHLFPQIAWDHYPDLVPILEATCAEFAVPYHTKGGFGEALACHVRYIASINDSSEYQAPPRPKGVSDKTLYHLGEGERMRKAVK